MSYQDNNNQQYSRSGWNDGSAGNGRRFREDTASGNNNGYNANGAAYQNVNRNRNDYNDRFDSGRRGVQNSSRGTVPVPNGNPNQGGGKPKKRASKVVIFIRVVAIILLLVGAAIVAIKLWGYYTAGKTHDSLKEIAAGESLEDYEKLYNMNKDFFGWLKIDDTVIDYPVMHTPDDPEHYLHTDFYGNYSESGELFMDANCPQDGCHYLIYGHHMFNGSMFGDLPKFGELDYYKAHQGVHFNTRTELGDYEIYAVFYGEIYDKSDTTHFKYYEYANLYNEETFNEYVQNVKSMSIYDTGITPEYGDKLLTLSTCNYHTEDGRFVVCAVKK